MRAQVYQEQGGQLWRLSDPLSCSPCLESQVIHRSTVNSEGQSREAQQERRGASAEVERRPESRVRLSGTGRKWTGMEQARSVSLRKPSPSQASLLTDPTPALSTFPSEALAQEPGFCRPLPYRPGEYFFPTPASVGGGGLLPWSKLSFLAGGVSPSPSTSTRSLLASESFRALSVTSGRGIG